MGIDTPSETGSVWDRLVKEQPAPAVKRAVEKGLAHFSQHKGILLDHLSKRRPINFRSFDEHKLWRRLITLAVAYFLWQATTPAGKREATLRKLAQGLGRVRVLRQDNVGSDLISQLLDGVLPREPRGQFVRKDDGTLGVVFFPEINFKEIVASLEAYKAAVLRAARDVPTRQSGPPPVLPRATFVHWRTCIEKAPVGSPERAWDRFTDL